MYPKALQYFYDFIDLFLSLIRLLWNSRFIKTRGFHKHSDKCIVMGNGPSLHTSIQKITGELNDYDLVAVNFMGISAEFTKFKPGIYILCDPAFWFDTGTDSIKQKVRELYTLLVQKTTWDLQLYLPWQAGKNEEVLSLSDKNPHIILHFYNKTKFEGFGFIKHAIYNRQWGMPRAQNVIAATLMLSIYSDYKSIYLAGADNDWVKNLWVDQKNRLRMADPHFYTESKPLEDRIIPIKIHEQFAALYYTFKTYVDIDLYAKKRGIEIVNLNATSYIDAFKKIEA